MAIRNHIYSTLAFTMVLAISSSVNGIGDRGGMKLLYIRTLLQTEFIVSICLISQLFARSSTHLP